MAATARLRSQFAALLVAITAILVGTTTAASASTTSALHSSSRINIGRAAETRVGVATDLGPVFVAQQTIVSPGQVGETCPRFDGITVGSCVATNTPADVDELLDSLPKGDSKGGRVRVVGSDTELGEKWDDLTRGGTPGEWKNYDGEVVRRPDGTEVGLRPGSRSGGRTIDIRTPGRKDRRIHVK